MMRLLAILLLLLTLGTYAAERRIKSTRPRTHTRVPQRKPERTVALIDTLRAPADSAVVVSGYEKPLRSRRESFFITNNLPVRLRTVALTLTYLDYRGAELHQRHETLVTDIPPGGTRRYELPAWDTQQSFYYIHGPKPTRTQQGMPYGVSVRVDYVTTATP